MDRSLAHGKTLQNTGFTMVEVMVALVVLAIGLLGMAGMTAVMMRGSRGATDLANATNICQQKIEGLKDIPWNDLGNPTGSTSPVDVGATAEGMIQERDLNSQGLTWIQLCKQQISITGSACDAQLSTACDAHSVSATCTSFLDQAGPYKYTRTFSICKGEDYTVGVIPTGSGPTSFTSSYSAEPNCKADPASNFRPQALACELNDVLAPGTQSEKMIKILCTWTTKEGRCSYVNFEALRMNNL